MEKRKMMPLSADQQTVADQFMDFLAHPTEREMVIKGFPGCGKSYLTKHLISLVRNSNRLASLLCDDGSDTKIICTATTNKAAAVLAEFTGEKTQTIHSLLGLKVTNNLSAGTTSLKKTKSYAPVENTIIFIDETSQTDTHLLNMIRQSTVNCKVVHIGDPYQLTAVHEKVCPVFTNISLQGELTGSQRFTIGGPIDTLAAGYRHAIDTGDFPEIAIDGKHIRHCNGADFKSYIDAAFGTSTNNADDHAKILAWKNDTVNQYNSYVRSLYALDDAFEVGEVVITNKPILDSYLKTKLHTEQAATVTAISEGEEYGVIGWWITLNNTISVFQPKHRNQVKQTIRELAQQAKLTKDWSMYFATQDFFADLRAVHASTVHKSQGSTFKKIFIDLDDIGQCRQPYVLARLLHVAVSRASDEIYLYGNLPPKYGSINHGL
jgi:exodeoxyribonuclease V